MPDNPLFINLGDKRIKLSNIKDYGIYRPDSKYVAAINVYNVKLCEESKVKGIFKKKSVTKYYYELADIYESVPCIEIAEEMESYYPEKRYAYTYKIGEKIYSSSDIPLVYFNGEIISYRDLDHDFNYKSNNSYVTKNGPNYLYITTYQNDNYRFFENVVGFDIYKKMKELDSYLT